MRFDAAVRAMRGKRAHDYLGTDNGREGWRQSWYSQMSFIYRAWYLPAGAVVNEHGLMSFISEPESIFQLPPLIRAILASIVSSV
jgi:hypothetical protein